MRRIIVKIEGGGASPETVQFSELSSYISYLETAIEEVMKSLKLDYKKPFLTLLSVEKGSHRDVIGLSEHAETSINFINESVLLGEVSRLPPSAHKALRDLNTQLFDNKRELFRVSSCEGDFELEDMIIDSRDTIPALPEPKLIKDKTSIYGKVVRINQRKKTASVILSNGQNVTLKNFQDSIAITLGKNMLRDVYVSGMGTWDANSWTLVSLDVSECDAVEDNGELFFDEMAKWFDLDAWNEAAGDERVDISSLIEKNKGS